MDADLAQPQGYELVPSNLKLAIMHDPDSDDSPRWEIL